MNTDISNIEMTEPDKSYSFTDYSKNLIAFFQISYDEYAENPMNDDCNGKIISLNRNHNNFDPDGFHDAIKNNPHTLPLSYYEHGNSVWSLQGEGPQCRFDSVYLAGAWVPDQDVMDNIHALNAKDEVVALREYARGVLKVYNQYCNGQAYICRIKLYNLMKDEEGEPIHVEEYYTNTRETIDEECCGGFFGWDDSVTEMKNTLDHMFTQKVLTN